MKPLVEFGHLARALPEQIVAHFYDIPYGHFAVLPPPQRLMYV